MASETRKCQNCKSDFIIEPEDFRFYEKISVPPPTWCPECRVVRRMVFRNERALYKRKCDFSKKEIISQYHADILFPVYETRIVYSDDWEPPYLDYDPTKSFFEQLAQLSNIVPRPALLTDVTSIEHNSLYQNAASRNKNCYMVFASGDNEQCLYGSNVDYSKDCIENFFIRDCELCHKCIDCIKSYKLYFSQDCQECTESYFLYDCRNCNNCFGCVGLRNKSYCYFNQQCSKKEYENMLGGALKSLTTSKKSFESFRLKYPHRFSSIKNSTNIKGNFIFNSRNIKNSFMIYDCEDCKNCYKLVAGKSCHDVSDWGDPGELCYESITVGKNAYQCLFSNNCWPGCSDIQYCNTCSVSNNLFACIGLRNKSYCILNKQYTKEEYEALLPRIIKHMNDMPYIDKKGRVYRYGEFFPPELSPFSYNETIAQEYFPLTKEEAIKQGYSWKDPEPRNYQITLKNKDIPDHIKDVPDSILNEIIECAHNVESNVESSTFNNTLGCPTTKCNEQCTQAFRIIPSELDFLRKQNLPLPRLCPNCRHYQRIKQRRPLKLWKRPCQCAGLKSANNVYENSVGHEHGGNPCPNKFDTAFAPERPEIVYCELCYLKEVV